MGADLDRGFPLDVLHALDKVAKDASGYALFAAEDDLNFTVNLLLDQTNLRGRHVLRYSEQVTA